jgi:hypothetical protein
VSSIPVSNTDNFSLGGLVGRNKTGSITQSYATGSITGGPNSVLGGLVATNDAGAGAVTSSYWDVQTTGQSSSVGGTGWTTAQLKAEARDYRNLIHPAKTIREKVRCDRGTAYVATGALEHVLSDLKRNL